MQDLDADFWSDLVDAIDEGRLIPIVETGVLRVAFDGQHPALGELLATRLAERLRVGLGDLDRAPTLEDVTSRHLARQPRGKGELYARTMQVLKDIDPAPPQALLDLAAITPLDLFVSVSFDGLLARAIDQVRHAGQPRCDSITFAPNRTADLPSPRSALTRPTVFHLLGRLSTVGECVICDDDRLEFLHALQDDARRPKLLFDELRDNHLLLIGCRLPDWAARFFLRTAKNERLSAGRRTREYLVGPQTAHDTALAGFLADFSPDTHLIDAEPEAFVAELRRRWQARHPASAVAPAAAAVAAAGLLQDGVVFISYSSRDVDAARTLAQALDARGIDVWFDKQQLGSGDAWETKILRGLKNCALFIPIVSATTLLDEHARDFFWTEWRAAHDRAKGMREDVVFVLPVSIDGTPPYTGKVPASFDERQWTALPGGQATPEFVDRVHQHYCNFQVLAERRKSA